MICLTQPTVTLRIVSGKAPILSAATAWNRGATVEGLKVEGIEAEQGGERGGERGGDR